MTLAIPWAFLDARRRPAYVSMPLRDGVGPLHAASRCKTIGRGEGPRYIQETSS
jgi:hypothetical protein